MTKEDLSPALIEVNFFYYKGCHDDEDDVDTAVDKNFAVTAAAAADDDVDDNDDDNPFLLLY